MLQRCTECCSVVLSVVVLSVVVVAADGLKQIWADLYGSVDVFAASPFVAVVVAVVSSVVQLCG